MPRADEAQTGNLSYNGLIPFVVNSSLLTLSTAQTDASPFVAPCDGEIVEAMAHVTVAPGTAPATVTVGNQSSDTALCDHTVPLTLTGSVDILSSFTEKTVSKGDVLLFGSDGAATSTGLAAVTLVIAPNAA